MEAKSSKNNKIIFDPLYGFIHLTPIEWEIIHTPFYQRLRWIKQIGFSCFTFPGAEHSRFGHSIGVMFNAHKIIESIGKAVPDEELFNENINSEEKLFHQSVRLAALLHDLGTFCFSHTTEMAYIKFGETTNQKNSKGHPDDHEHLGSWIIKNTDYESGITHILKKYNIEPQLISDLVKGVAPSQLANQILHSEIDCDRMDYLLRDAHYTGLNYGTYDRDYLLHHFRVQKIGQEEVLAIKHNALHCVEDFLSARFAWYSQVVRSARGAKFDALAEEITFYLLEKGQIFTYSELLDMVKNDPIKFYSFNDHYFMSLIHRLYTEGFFNKNPRIKDIAHALLFEKSPRTVRVDEFRQRILNQDDITTNDKIIKKAHDKVDEIRSFLKKNGTENDWLVVDIPKKNIVFVNSKKRIIKNAKNSNLLLERDPAKILTERGDVQLLVDIDNSVISMLQNSFNFVPNVYCSDSAYSLLESSGILK
jgi:HD superfamily phosphohydrolase